MTGCPPRYVSPPWQPKMESCVQSPSSSKQVRCRSLTITSEAVASSGMEQSDNALHFLHAPECNHAGERSGSRTNRAAIVAAMNDPLAVGCLSRDDPDVM